MSKTIITCAVNGVFTNPKQHNVPVTPEEMAAEARRAYEAGASVMHIHLRQQGEGKGHLASWDATLSAEVQDAIRASCPDVIINHTTGTPGKDYSKVFDCLRATRPEMAACNAGSLNYLKLRANGEWAWPPILFDNAVAKVKDFIDAITESGGIPEFECFDTGIVRCVEMYQKAGLFSGTAQMNFVMGVASGMPANPALLDILLPLMPKGARWQVTAIGRSEIWPMHQRTAELGGHLRTGLEDTFYLASGEKVSSNGPLIEAIAAVSRNAGRDIATPQEARAILGIA